MRFFKTSLLPFWALLWPSRPLWRPGSDSPCKKDPVRIDTSHFGHLGNHFRPFFGFWCFSFTKKCGQRPPAKLRSLRGPGGPRGRRRETRKRSGRPSPSSPKKSKSGPSDFDFQCAMTEICCLQREALKEARAPRGAGNGVADDVGRRNSSRVSGSSHTRSFRNVCRPQCHVLLSFSIIIA